jgi:glyoxylase-like metal-dependent hydrolase (beta-lactamase superfamily II)
MRSSPRRVSEEFWAHENCAEEIGENGDAQRSEVTENEPEMAAGEGENVELVVPNAIVRDQPVLVDLGGQTVTLFYLGRGHTDGDLLVGTTTTLFAGDLVEQGSHPSFEDSYPEEWADALRHLSALRHRYEFLVPGHGEPCSDRFVKTMADTMTTAVRQARQSIRDTPADATKAIPCCRTGRSSRAGSSSGCRRPGRSTEPSTPCRPGTRPPERQVMTTLGAAG